MLYNFVNMRFFMKWTGFYYHLSIIYYSVDTRMWNCSQTYNWCYQWSGTWENVNDELIIDTVDNTLLYNAKDGTVYEGNEIVVKEINNKAGTVFFKQTKVYERCFEDPDDASYTHWLCWWRYSTTAPGVGNSPLRSSVTRSVYR